MLSLFQDFCQLFQTKNVTKCSLFHMFPKSYSNKILYFFQILRPCVECYYLVFLVFLVVCGVRDTL